MPSAHIHGRSRACHHLFSGLVDVRTALFRVHSCTAQALHSPAAVVERRSDRLGSGHEAPERTRPSVADHGVPDRRSDPRVGRHSRSAVAECDGDILRAAESIHVVAADHDDRSSRRAVEHLRSVHGSHLGNENDSAHVGEGCRLVAVSCQCFCRYLNNLPQRYSHQKCNARWPP